MEEKDIKQIGELFDSKLNEFGEIVNNGFVEMDKRFEGQDKRFITIENRLNKIESQMVTKEYIDDKLADLKGDLVAKVRLEDEKVNATINLLDKHEIIPGDELKSVKDMELFPKLTV